MIIECKSCHARFRLDESKIKGRGARVKCRKCGEQIVVLKETDPAPAPGDGRKEGMLDLGSALRETPPDNLIHFPKPSTRTEELKKTADRDEVDIAFEQLLERSATPEEAKAKPPVEEWKLELPPEEPKFEAPPEEPKFEAPVEEPRFVPPAELSFEPPRTEEEPKFELPPEEPNFELPVVEPKFEPPAGLSFEPPAEEPKFEAPAGLMFESPAEAAAAEKGFAPEAALDVPPDIAPEGKTAPPSLKEEDAPRPDFGNDADISLAIAPEPAATEPDLPLESTAFSVPKEASAAPPPEEIAVEGNATPPAAVLDVEPPPYREEPPEEPAAQAPPPEPAGTHAGTSPARASTGRIAVLVLVLALFGAAGYLGFTESGKKLLGSVSPGLAALTGGSAETAASRYEVKNVIGYYDSGAASPRILVIKGQVTNLASAPKSGIRIVAALLDNTGKVLTEQAVYAGNVLPGATLKSEDRATLEKALANPLGEHLMNMDVPSGKTIPFMVLFFDAPEDIDSYRLEAKDNK